MEAIDLSENQVTFRRNAKELAPLLTPSPSTPEEATDFFHRLGASRSLCAREACKIVCAAAEESGSADFALHTLFVSIGEWALAALQESEDGTRPVEQPWQPDGSARTCTFTAKECRGILANILLLNVNDPVGWTGLKPACKYGGLSLARSMLLCPDVGVHKLACLLQYFATSLRLQGTADDARQVILERRVGVPLQELKASILDRGEATASSLIRLHDDVMESVPADGFVNFANPVFGYGEFIASCTQEEIIQVCCPEFNVGMLFIGTMQDSEVVVVRGCRRYSAYTGYSHTFKYIGEWTGHTKVQSILTMDACTSSHFTERKVLRDIQKALLCFQGHQTISTGRWGCGVFGGVPAHKLVQQLIAAQMCDQATLYFSTFGSSDGCDELLAGIVSQGKLPSPATMLQALLDCAGNPQSDFVGHFLSNLERISVAGSKGGTAQT